MIPTWHLLNGATAFFADIGRLVSGRGTPFSRTAHAGKSSLLSGLIPTPEYQTLTIPNSDLHSFHYWNRKDGIPGADEYIRDHVVDFLEAHLK